MKVRAGLALRSMGRKEFSDPGRSCQNVSIAKGGARHRAGGKNGKEKKQKKMAFHQKVAQTWKNWKKPVDLTLPSKLETAKGDRGCHAPWQSATHL